MGGVFGIATEFLVYARCGSLKSKYSTKINWFEVKRKYKNGYPNHSAKPDFFRELIDKTFDGNKIELFAREKTQGWDVWGDEVESDIIL